jgi:hypothetical protein
MSIDDGTGGSGAVPAEATGQDLSRRAFMRGAGGAVVIGLAVSGGITQLAVGQVFAAPAASTDRRLFERCVGTAFTNKTSGTSQLTLIKVRSLRYFADDPSSDSFSLLFRGPAHQPLGQEVYTLHHRVTGNRSVLVTPLQAEPDACFYEVIFNRAVQR